MLTLTCVKSRVPPKASFDIIPETHQYRRLIIIRLIEVLSLPTNGWPTFNQSEVPVQWKLLLPRMHGYPLSQPTHIMSYLWAYTFLVSNCCLLTAKPF